MKNKNFTIIDKKIKSIDEDGSLYITGIANTGERDLVGDVVTEQALSEIAAQAINRNLHFNHSGNFDSTLDDLTESILGTITEARVIEEGVEITARILPKHAENVRYFLENDVKLGLSISGVAHYEENSWEQIESWDLTEISLVPVPCDQGTMGTVRISKSFTDFVSNLKKADGVVEEVGGETMAEEVITKDEVIELINAAFNEKEEELLEAVRKENEQKFSELIARIEALENAEPEPEEEEVVEGSEEEVVEDSKSEEQQEEDEEEGAESSEEDEEKKLNDIINKKVEEKINNIFKGIQTPEFKYRKEQKSSPDEEAATNKKGYTAQEIAEAIVRRNM